MASLDLARAGPTVMPVPRGPTALSLRDLQHESPDVLAHRAWLTSLVEPPARGQVVDLGPHPACPLDIALQDR